MTVLFLCRHHSVLSPMAKAIFTHLAPVPFEVLSAGLIPKDVHHLSAQVLEEEGIRLNETENHSIYDYEKHKIDVLISLEEHLIDQIPILTGNPVKFQWNLLDPSQMDPKKNAILQSFRDTRDDIISKIRIFIEDQYLAILSQMRNFQSQILDNISDGIFIHDEKRRIYYINKAAEQILGVKQKDIAGTDCHDIFPSGFCGNKCVFRDSTEFPEKNPVQYKIDIRTKKDARKRLSVQVHTLFDQDSKPYGVMNTFHDISHEYNNRNPIEFSEQNYGIIGNHPKMKAIYELIYDVSRSTIPVLITGESGTGKELVATAIHRQGIRSQKHFVPVNCSALPETLVESELFGHVKGAFTGAIRDKKGRFELAHGGTIFLDEIGDLSPLVQVKLLRVLQEGTFEKVGSETTVKVDVRLICATNKDLQQEIKKGAFREDLFYRICVMPIELPPLRERRSDIALLIRYFLQKFAKEYSKESILLAQDTMDIFLEYHWHGNIRELQNVIQHALIKCKEAVIKPEHLPAAMLTMKNISTLEQHRRRRLDSDSVLRALNETRGNKVKAAKLLDVSRATLYRFIEKENLAT